MNNRIKTLRKHLNLTQQEFGKRIGMKQNTIALIEGGRGTSDQTIFAICREYNVNEKWLRSGEGEMFKELSDDVEMSFLFSRILNPDDNDEVAQSKRALIREILTTDEAAWPYILEFLKNLTKSVEKKEEGQE